MNEVPTTIINGSEALETFGPGRSKALARLADQRGMALILALFMLVILSLLGALALSVSTTDIKISGNLKNQQNAFFAAEAAVEYAMGNVNIVQSIGTIDLNRGDHPSGDHPSNLSIGGTKLDPNATNQVVSLGPGELPDSLADRFGREKFGGAYYTISVTGLGINERSQTRIEAERVRVYQKDDEGMLITTGSGG
jgi:type II secretory pathway pseudopilin PulG